VRSPAPPCRRAAGACGRPSDNADRLTRLGIARTIDRRRYSAERAAAELERLLEDREYSRRAGDLSGHVRQEDGVATACDALEALLARDAR
jgi:rhamnosyltransferase subunit B